MKIGICALCGSHGNIHQSHIIPKFVSNWIKSTSATGILRYSTNPDKRRQDGPKHNLLCSDCETRFSKYEDYFAKTIFYPFLNENKNEFEYNEKLMKFIISVSWRILKLDLERIDPSFLSTEQKSECSKALSYWKSVLLNDEVDAVYEHHIFLAGDTEEPPIGISRDYEMYMMRATDGTISKNSKIVMIYFKFPGILFFSSIYPKKLSGFDNTKLSNKGTLSPPYKIVDGNVGSFIVSRVDAAFEKKASKRQQDLVARTMLKNSDRYSKSLSRKYLERKFWSN